MALGKILTIDAKKTVLKKLLALWEQKLTDIKKSAKAAHGGATHEDAVAKSKYDTHGLELSYLAGSQQERALKLQAEILQLKQFQLRSFKETDSVQVGAFVALRSQGEERAYFILNHGSGVKVNYEGIDIQVISPESPLGENLLDGYLNDDIYFDERAQNCAQIFLIS